MKKLKHLVLNEQGIHARSATVLVSTAMRYCSNITLWKGDESADMKKLFQVMKLCVKQNTLIIIGISGQDEVEAAKDVEKVLSTL